MSSVPHRVILYLAAGLAVLALAVCTGCSSTGDKTVGSHAGVTLRGHNVTDVVLTTRDVFEANGFALKHAETDRMVFERPGTKSDRFKYGSFGSPDVIIRAKVDLEQLGPDTFFLRCDAFSVRDAGDSVLEDETRLILGGGRQYQKILDEVKSRLDSKVTTQGGAAP